MLFQWSFLKPGLIICVWRYALDLYSSGVFTQVLSRGVQKARKNQDYEHVQLLGSDFKKLDKYRTTLEMEAFAIFSEINKLVFISQWKPRTGFCRPSQPFLLFPPLIVESMLGRHVVYKDQRWSLFISQFLVSRDLYGHDMGYLPWGKLEWHLCQPEAKLRGDINATRGQPVLRALLMPVDNQVTT